MATTANLKKGNCIIFKGEPHLIVGKFFVSPGKGSAFFRTKLKNLKTKSVAEFTFKSGEKIEEAPVLTQEFQYLYKQGEEYFFMNPRSYEQVSLSTDSLENFAKFLKEGEVYRILMLDDQPINLIPPQKVRFKVVEAEEGDKGNTVSGADKPVTLENGSIVHVPLFVKKGDTIIINAQTGEYVARG